MEMTTIETIKEDRRKLQSLLRDYAENIWETGGETRIAHDAEVQVLFEIQNKVTSLRKCLQESP